MVYERPQVIRSRDRGVKGTEEEGLSQSQFGLAFIFVQARLPGPIACGNKGIGERKGKVC